jgi:hypothetical protein
MNIKKIYYFVAPVLAILLCIVNIVCDFIIKNYNDWLLILVWIFIGWTVLNIFFVKEIKS